MLGGQAVEVVKEKPALNAEDRQKRIAKLEQERNQTIANLNALDGAIQEAQYWLAQVMKADQKAAEKK